MSMYRKASSTNHWIIIGVSDIGAIHTASHYFIVLFLRLSLKGGIFWLCPWVIF